jgi:hypothetical protein
MGLDAVQVRQMGLPRQHLHLELAERFEVVCPRQSLNGMLPVRRSVLGDFRSAAMLRSASAEAL